MRKLHLVIIGCLSLLFIVGCTSHDMHDMEMSDVILVPHSHSHDHGSMEHDKYEVDPENAPTVSLTVHEDPKGGWNLQVLTENIEMAPEQASLDHVEGQGHMHFYIDGSKITRLYGEWYHVPKDWLKPGTYEFSVTLSANDHGEYFQNGEAISDSVMVTVS